MKNKKIGWIGTGVMGKSMCSFIIKQEYEVLIYNRTKQKAQELIDIGAIWCDSPKQVAQNSDIIFTMVGFPKDVESSIFGNEGILENMKEGSIYIDMTTSKPVLAIEIFNKAQQKRISTLDCPVTGGDIGAKNGTLTIFAGGDKKTFEQVLPILELMGKNVQYVGSAGAGQHAKMCNQIAVAAGIIGTVETLIYAKHSGLDLNQIISMVGSGAGASWQITNMGPRIINKDFDPGFYIKHFIKDLEIALQECEKMEINLPGLNLAHDLYIKAQQKGYENLGTQGLYKLFE